MNMTIALALLASGVLLFWCTMIGTRLAQPPRWTADTMVMCVIVPAILVFSAAGGGTFAYLLATGAWHGTATNDVVGIAVVLAVAVTLGALIARWSRRAPRRAVAEVIAMPQPETPQPPRPVPKVGRVRKAA